jgi:hypothetical protein
MGNGVMELEALEALKGIARSLWWIGLAASFWWIREIVSAVARAVRIVKTQKDGECLKRTVIREETWTPNTDQS